MDEIEARLAAVEGLLMERLALDSHAQFIALIDQVRGWPDEQLRAQALQVLDEALRRFDEMAMGLHRPRGSA